MNTSGIARVGGLFAMSLAVLCGCKAQETNRTLQPSTVTAAAPAAPAYTGPKYRLAIGKFANKSPYMNGIFSDGTDRLGMQAQQILKNHLAQSQRFVVVDRVNMEELAKEAQIAGQQQQLTAGEIVITGAVTEFGRRETGSVGLGGLISRKKIQQAYSKVSLSIVEVRTSRVLYSAQGAGEFDLSNEHVLGFGSEAGYDATLTDKVLNLAIIEAVNRLVEGMDKGQWKPGAAE